MTQLTVNLKPGHDGREAYQPTLDLRRTKILERFLVLGDRHRLGVVDCQLPADHASRQ